MQSKPYSEKRTSSTKIREIAMFDKHIACLQVISRTLKGVTIGQMMKENPWLTRGQVERIVKNLLIDEYIWEEVVPFGRTGKKLYRLTERAAIAFAAIARDYTQACDEQPRLPDM